VEACRFRMGTLAKKLLCYHDGQPIVARKERM
jgi:hypothetical protein